MRVLHHNVYKTPLGRANALVPSASSCLTDRSLTGPGGARGDRMAALPRSTTHLLALSFAALLLIFPTIADAMPLAGGPPLPPLPGDDTGGDDLEIKGATLFGRENN